jgi:hypothetical protein
LQSAAVAIVDSGIAVLIVGSVSDVLKWPPPDNAIKLQRRDGKRIVGGSGGTGSVRHNRA